MPKGAGRHRAKRIVVYNHKGGVGKTTLTLNIAAALGSLKKKVLLVDSDPQCNLTSYVVEDSVVDDLLERSDNPSGSTVWSALKPVAEGTGEIKRIKAVDLSIPNVRLLPGDIRVSEFEQELTQLWADCLQRKVRGFRGTGALSAIANDAAWDQDADFVFFDAGPNIGPLNRTILLDCDYFVVPTACDLFSVRALKTLGYTLSAWIRDWQTISSLAPDSLETLPGRPKLLGYVPQRFRVYRGQLSAGHASYLSRIDKQMYADVIAVLREVDKELAAGTPSSYKLGQVKDYGSIVAASQAEGVPIKDTTNGAESQRTAAKEAFEQIAQRIIEAAR